MAKIKDIYAQIGAMLTKKEDKPFSYLYQNVSTSPLSAPFLTEALMPNANYPKK